jgi:hypothetical protein
MDDTQEGKHYIPIGLCQTLYKLFTKNIAKWLSAYMEEYPYLEETKAGFRPELSTLSHIFTLQQVVARSGLEQSR